MFTHSIWFISPLFHVRLTAAVLLNSLNHSALRESSCISDICLIIDIKVKDRCRALDYVHTYQDHLFLKLEKYGFPILLSINQHFEMLLLMQQRLDSV